MNLLSSSAQPGVDSLSVFKRRDARAHLVVCAILVAFAAALLIPLATHGWIAHDEGTVAQTAHRILLGELPHRDFDDVYTGGLAMLHAGAFRVLGERLSSLRIVLFTFILCSIPAFYYIASRFASPVPAGVATATLIGWSFTNYAASMPSWYNLLFAAAGCAALMRWRETDRIRWLWIAGLCAGCSITIKIIGVYFVAAALLFLAFQIASPSEENHHARRASDVAYRVVFGGAIALASLIPFALVRRTATLGQWINLAFPAAATGIFVAVSVLRTADKRSVSRMLKNIAVLVAGVAIPVLLFMIPYVKSGSVMALYEGLFVLPQKRLTWAAAPGPPAWTVLLAPLWISLVFVPFLRDARLGRNTLAVCALVAVAAVAAGTLRYFVYIKLWLAIAMAMPALVVVGLALLLRGASPKQETSTVPIEREHLFLLLVVTTWCGLVQFPFSSPVYFCYIAPFVILTAFAMGSMFAQPSSRVAFLGLATCLLVGLFGRREFDTIIFGSRVTLLDEPTAVLDLRRGGLVVKEKDRATYVALADTIRAHATSKFIYVTPDAPEVYFLAERENPTRTLFDFFDDPIGRNERILQSLRAHDVHLVVLNWGGEFSGRVPKALYDSLDARYPMGTGIGQFEVRWDARTVAGLPRAGDTVGQPPKKIADTRQH